MHNPSTAAANSSHRAAEYPQTQMTQQTNESSDKRVKLWETLRPCEKCDWISERGSGPLALVANAPLLATAWFIIALSEKEESSSFKQQHWQVPHSYFSFMSCGEQKPTHLSLICYSSVAIVVVVVVIVGRLQTPHGYFGDVFLQGNGQRPRPRVQVCPKFTIVLF